VGRRRATNSVSHLGLHGEVRRRRSRAQMALRASPSSCGTGCRPARAPWRATARSRCCAPPPRTRP
jgi:hypothetical protein